MMISERGLDLIKSFEGIRDGNPNTVNLDPYLCPAGVATIGWGHAIVANGKQLRGPLGLDIAQRMFPEGITKDEAEELLREDAESVARDVTELLQVEVSQAQFDALCSFAFNVGTDIDADDLPEGLGDSTLLKFVNRGELREAAEQFPKWNKSGGKVLSGLTRRRAAERAMFLEDVA